MSGAVARAGDHVALTVERGDAPVIRIESKGVTILEVEADRLVLTGRVPGGWKPRVVRLTWRERITGVQKGRRDA
jgi:hypothetical protein